MKPFLTTVVGLLFAASISLEAAEYHVSPEGNAEATGTASDPFGSLVREGCHLPCP